MPLKKLGFLSISSNSNKYSMLRSVRIIFKIILPPSFKSINIRIAHKFLERGFLNAHTLRMSQVTLRNMILSLFRMNSSRKKQELYYWNFYRSCHRKFLGWMHVSFHWGRCLVSLKNIMELKRKSKAIQNSTMRSNSSCYSSKKVRVYSRITLKKDN